MEYLLGNVNVPEGLVAIADLASGHSFIEQTVECEKMDVDELLVDLNA